MENRTKKLQSILDELGYYQKVDQKSVPLVERLISDLTVTTESLQKYMKIAQSAIDERDNLEIGAEPFKCDNKNLAREKQRLQRYVKELENKVAEYESSVGKRKTTKKSSSTKEFDSAIALSDEKIMNLSKDIKKLRDHNMQLIEANEILQAQLSDCNREVVRLSEQLTNDNEISSPKTCLCNKENYEAQFGPQQQPELGGDFSKVVMEKNTLENRLRDALSKQHEAMKRALHLAERNKQLEMEMKDIDQLAMAVEAECNNSVKCSSEKVKRLQDRMHETMLQIQRLERDNLRLKQDKQELCADLDAVQLEKKHLQTVLETSLDEKKRLNDRINCFTIIERDLNLEIDRLTRLSAEQKRKLAELECTVTDRTHESPAAYSMKLLEAQEIVLKLRNDNKVLTQENFKLLSLLEKAKDSPYLDAECFRPQCKRFERENCLLRSDIERLEEERASLKLKLKNQSENQIYDTDRYKKALQDAESQLKKLELERRDLMHGNNGKKELEDQIDKLRNELKFVNSELNHQKVIYTQLKILHEQTDKTLAETQSKLLAAENDLASASSSIKKRDFDHSLANKEVNSLKSDLQIIKSQLSQIDREKDELVVTLDDKTEKLARMEMELKAKDKSIESLEGTISDLKKKISLTIDESANQEHLYRTSQTELIQLKQELDRIKRLNQMQSDENRRLQDDLTALTLDNRQLGKDLELHKRQVDDLKTQLQHYVAEVKRTEDLISNKEVERNELLDQFRSLSHEANVLETNNHTLENEASQSKLQLSLALDHAHDLEQRLEAKNSIIQSYEKQIAELTSQIASLEIQLRQFMHQTDGGETELRNLQEKCMRLEMDNAKFKRQLRDREDEQMKLDRNVEQLRSERELLRENLSKDKRSVDKMEHNLTEAKAQSNELRMINENLQDEVQNLKLQMKEIKDRLHHTTEQLDMYQEKALEYSQQNKQLRRDLANERFRKSRDSESATPTPKYPSL